MFNSCSSKGKQSISQVIPKKEIKLSVKYVFQLFTMLMESCTEKVSSIVAMSRKALDTLKQFICPH